MSKGISNEEIGVSEYSGLHGLIGTANLPFFTSKSFANFIL